MSSENDNGGLSPEQEETMERINTRASEDGVSFEEAAQRLGIELCASAKDMREGHPHLELEEGA
jgi:hypothetical protein